ncbi:eef-1B.1 [Pristionchus pacificus]|uniref:Eef-1B.1 n=1 Tax=Pristionchus pacificus TaxID=54126 RepID=A0A454XRZ3_PRIPA|nr:eef-1B.1 [Pristionchus pacificus]|eukprot:PDM77939.1 eef-1B.1 [Pristionchus pacificus]
MSFDLKNDAGLKAFNDALATQAFATGFVLSGDDAALFDSLKAAPDAKKFANVARWYKNVASYDKKERAEWAGATTSAAAAADDDEDIDLFGSDSEDEEKAKQTAERLREYAAKKSKKPGPIAKSNIIFDVKPWDDTIDIAEIEKSVRSIEMDGLVWGAGKILPVAFGIKKLQICCVVEDDKVSTDALEESITGFEDLVQSIDVVAFNKV